MSTNHLFISTVFDGMLPNHPKLIWLTLVDDTGWTHVNPQLRMVLSPGASRLAAIGIQMCIQWVLQWWWPGPDAVVICGRRTIKVPFDHTSSYPTAVQTVKTCREMNRFGLSGFLRFLLHFCGVSCKTSLFPASWLEEFLGNSGGFGMMTCPFQYAPSIHLLTVHIRLMQCRLHSHCIFFVGLCQDWFRMCL